MEAKNLPDVFVTLLPGTDTLVRMQRLAVDDGWELSYPYKGGWQVDGVFDTDQDMLTYFKDMFNEYIFVPFKPQLQVMQGLNLNLMGTQTGRFSSEKPNASFVDKEEGPDAATIRADDNFVTQCKLAFAGILAISPEKYKNMLCSLAESTGYLPTAEFQTAVRAELEAWEPLPEDI
jgi:hypothetical protein